MNAYKLLLILFVFVLLLGSCQPSTDKDTSQPNIVLLFCDDLGYGDLGITGHPTIRTPHLDQMAAEGLRMTQFYSASPACTASRYGLLTGKYPIRSGFSWVLFPQSTRGIHPKEKTIAETLQANGYKTACFGKWHLGSTKKEYFPTQNGFDEFIGLPYSNDMIPPIHPDIALLHNEDTIALNPDQSELTELYTENALRFIRQQKDHPFFLYLPYAMPHLPLHPGKSFEGQSIRGKYGDVVEEIDWSTGQINQLLDSLGIAENTIVLFTSDNGPWIIKNEEGGSSGLFRDGKGSTWEGGMRVPAIVKWPSQIPAASISTQVASTIDLYNTITELIGQSEEEQNDGMSLLPYWLQPDKQEDRTFFYYGPSNKLHAIRKGRWKLHLKTSSQTGKQYYDYLPLLFDIEADPSEQYELSKLYPDTVQLLQRLWEEHLTKVKETPNFYEKEMQALFQKHLAYQVMAETSPSYKKYGKASVLTDGYPGESDQFNTFYAVQGEDLSITIDLQKPEAIDSVQVSFLRRHSSWVFLPETVEVLISQHGKDYTSLGTISSPIASDFEKDVIQTFSFEQTDTKAQFVKIRAQQKGVCPDWHPGAAQPSWLMTDEVYVF